MNIFRNPKRKSVNQLLQQREEELELLDDLDEDLGEESEEEVEETPKAVEVTEAAPPKRPAAMAPANESKPPSNDRQLTEADIFRPSRSSQVRPATPPAPKNVPAASGTVIGSGVSFNGQLIGTEDITILGKFEGKIHLEGNLHVGEKGEVHANVKATSVKICGKVEGNLVATERLELSSTAKVMGDMVAPRLSMNDGAGFKGRVSMNMEEAKKTFDTKLPATKSTAKPDVVQAKPKTDPDEARKTISIKQGVKPTAKAPEPVKKKDNGDTSGALILGG